MDEGRVVRFGLKGSSDILGIYRGGYILAIEVKTGRGRQTVYQQRFQAMIERFGGRYVIVASAEECEAWLDSIAL